MTDAPSPFLRRLLSQKDVANPKLIDDLVDMSDTTLTLLLRGVSVTPAHFVGASDHKLIAELADTHETSGYWISECICARVLDRWLEEKT